jgi:hypothetical protein
VRAVVRFLPLSRLSHTKHRTHLLSSFLPVRRQQGWEEIRDFGMELISTSERGEASEVSHGLDSEPVAVSGRRRRLQARTARRAAGRREGRGPAPGPRGEEEKEARRQWRLLGEVIAAA